MSIPVPDPKSAEIRELISFSLSSTIREAKEAISGVVICYSSDQEI